MPLVYDFQYCGKACVAKDLAYFFNVDVMAGAAEEKAPVLPSYHPYPNALEEEALLTHLALPRPLSLGLRGLTHYRPNPTPNPYPNPHPNP